MSVPVRKRPSRPSSTASAVSSQADASEHRPAYAVRSIGDGGCEGRISRERNLVAGKTESHGDAPSHGVGAKRIVQH